MIPTRSVLAASIRIPNHHAAPLTAMLSWTQPSWEFPYRLFTTTTTTASGSSSSGGTSTSQTTQQTRTRSNRNINLALKKEFERQSLTQLVAASKHQSVTILQGIGPKHQAQLASLKLHTISDLAKYKYFHLARCILTLSQVEEQQDVVVDDIVHEHKHATFSTTSQRNLDRALDQAYEGHSFHDLVQAPPSALQGLTAADDETLQQLGINTIAELATWKFCAWAEAMIVTQSYEVVPTATTTTTTTQSTTEHDQP